MIIALEEEEGGYGITLHSTRHEEAQHNTIPTFLLHFIGKSLILGIGIGIGMERSATYLSTHGNR